MLWGKEELHVHGTLDKKEIYSFHAKNEKLVFVLIVLYNSDGFGRRVPSSFLNYHDSFLYPKSY